MIKTLSIALVGGLFLVQSAHAVDVTKREEADVVHSKFDTSGPSYKSKEYIELKTPRGATQPLVYKTVEGAKANIILMKGGNGKFDLSRTKRAGRGNFSVRTRGLFAKAGYNVALPYLPKDKKEIFKFRATADHANDIAEVVKFLKEENGLPVWIAGNSYSGISAVNVAQAMGADQVEGIILAAVALYDKFNEQKWTDAFADRKKNAGSEYAVMKIDLVDATGYTGKVVYLNNQEDTCPTSLLRNEADVTGLFPNAAVKILHVNGGDIKPRKTMLQTHCIGLNKHSFYKIENEAVSAVTNAMTQF